MITPHQILDLQIKMHVSHEPIKEFKFHPTRKWRADFAWPDRNLLLEVEGGVWINGRHTRGSGFIKDCEKYNEAAVLGYKLLRVTEEHINSGQAISWINKFMA